jgi:hypothetical protein
MEEEEREQDEVRIEVGGEEEGILFEDGGEEEEEEGEREGGEREGGERRRERRAGEQVAVTHAVGGGEDEWLITEDTEGLEKRGERSMKME